jgi:hypothetical protein
VRLHWWSVLELGVGALWLLTSFVGTRGVMRQPGVTPRAGRSALWLQRVIGLVLVILGLVDTFR